MQYSRGTDRWWLALALALAVAVRLFQLGDRVVWFDEAVSLLVAKASVADIIAAANDDTHPPLYNLALHFCPRGEPAARGFSVACGVLTVALVFFIGRRLGACSHAAPPACGERGDGAPRLQQFSGAVSAGLMALCPLHVWYSQEVRMYALQTLLVTASWWLLFVALERPRFWIGYTVTAALSLYAQYTSAFALAAQWLYVLWLRRDALRPWLLAQAGVALLFAPCVPLFLHHLVGGTFGFWLGKFSWNDPLRFFALLSGAIPKNPGSYWPWVALSLVLLVIATIRQGRKAAPLLLWLLAPVALLAMASLRSNAFLPRALVMVTPAFALLIGLSISRPKNGRWVPVAPILAVALVAANLVALQRYYVTPNPWIRSPLRETALTVERDHQRGDVVMHSSRFSYRPFQFYLGDNVAQGLARASDDEPSLYRAIGNGRMPTGAPRRIWLVLWPDFQQPGFHNQVLAQMNAQHPRHREVFSSPQLLVMLYEMQ